MAVKLTKKKPAAGKSSDHWFYKKSPAAQKAYIAAHPNSIFAKKAKGGAKAGVVDKSEKAKALVTYRKMAAKLDDMEDREPKGGAAFVRWEAKMDKLRAEMKAFKTANKLKVPSGKSKVKADKARSSKIAKNSGTAAGQALAAKLERLKKARSRMTLFNSEDTATQRAARRALIEKRDANIRKLEDKLHNLG